MKPGYKFNHFGIPAADNSRAPMYAAPLKVWLSDFNADPFRCEWLHFEEGSTFPELIQKTAHVAYEVPSLADALVGEKVLVEPFPGGENLMCAFIEADGYAVELMEFKK